MVTELNAKRTGVDIFETEAVVLTDRQTERRTDGQTSAGSDFSAYVENALKLIFPANAASVVITDETFKTIEFYINIHTIIITCLTWGSECNHV